MIPFYYFFENSSGNHTDKSAQSIHCSESNTVDGEVVDEQVGYPYESGMEECSQGVQNSSKGEAVFVMKNAAQ